MLDKRMTAAEIVAQLSDGMTIGIGGWGPRRKPMALVREILRSDLKDLTIVAYGGADVGMLCAAGAVSCGAVFAGAGITLLMAARMAAASVVFSAPSGWSLRCNAPYQVQFCQ